MEKPKFNIGDMVFVVESSCHYGVKIPCRMCFGKRRVTVILGNDEQVVTECGYCQAGIDPPTGYSTTWEPRATVSAEKVLGIRRSDDGWRYEVGYQSVLEDQIFLTREEAEPVAAEKLKIETERKALLERDHFITATKKQVWSAGYHLNRIKDHERQIGWHKMRLCMIEEKKTK